LVTALAKLAPASAVDVLPVGIAQLETALEAAEIDLAVAYFHDPPPRLRQRWRRKSEHGDEWKLCPVSGPEERACQE